MAGGNGASVISVARAESGASYPVLGALADPYAVGGIEVAVSRDGRYAFVSMEGSAAIAVFRLHQALTSGFGSVGLFPRDVSVDGGQLLVANFDSGSLETIQAADLP